MSSMLARKAAAIYAAEQLASLGDCQSITITRVGSSEDFCVRLVTKSSDTFVMTLNAFSAEGFTSASPLRSDGLERSSRNSG